MKHLTFLYFETDSNIPLRDVKLKELKSKVNAMINSSSIHPSEVKGYFKVYADFWGAKQYERIRG